MSTTTNLPAPLPLSGNTTPEQNALLQKLLGEGVQQAFQTIIERIDRQSVQFLLDGSAKFSASIAELLVKEIERRTASDRYKAEQVPSERTYPPSYRIYPIEAQVTELRKNFPQLGKCHEKLARRPLPEGAEGWFAIPRWQALAPTYNEAVEAALRVLGSKRRIHNRIADRMGAAFLRQSSRSVLGTKILAEQQPDADILVAAAQMGMRHRGRSARRARMAMAANEFGADTLSVASILLTHPERLSSETTLMIDCGGDEYSVRGDLSFDRVPLFDYDISGVEFSIFYDDRARDLWGTPSVFVYKTD